MENITKILPLLISTIVVMYLSEQDVDIIKTEPVVENEIEVLFHVRIMQMVAHSKPKLTYTMYSTVP
jgi:hypothetical protein